MHKTFKNKAQRCSTPLKEASLGIDEEGNDHMASQMFES